MTVFILEQRMFEMLRTEPHCRTDQLHRPLSADVLVYGVMPQLARIALNLSVRCLTQARASVSSGQYGKIVAPSTLASNTTTECFAVPRRGLSLRGAQEWTTMLVSSMAMQWRFGVVGGYVRKTFMCFRAMLESRPRLR